MSGMRALAEAAAMEVYENLGEPIKASLTYEEWLWLSDAEKARYLANATEPESFNDGV